MMEWNGKSRRRDTGQSQLQIPRDFIVTPSVVSNLWKQFSKNESPERNGQYRQRAMTANEDPYLSITEKGSKSARARQLSRGFLYGRRQSSFKDYYLSRTTCRLLLAIKPAFCVHSLLYTRKRIQRSEDIINFTKDQWGLYYSPMRIQSKYKIST